MGLLAPKVEKRRDEIDTVVLSHGTLVNVISGEAPKSGNYRNSNLEWWWWGQRVTHY